MYNEGTVKWTLLPGEHVLDWEVLRPLGRGGMGEIYLVQRASRPSYPYALKLFAATHATSHFFKQRFFALGEQLLQLAHPSLSKVLDLGTLSREDGDYPFLIMTFIGMSADDCAHLLTTQSPPKAPSPIEQHRSYSLADILVSPHGFSIHWLERWFNDIVEALHYLHNAGFAHGDIKPTNILISATGRAILIDFGLASALNEERTLPPGYETTTDALHATTLFRGTPAFVAPERLTGGTPTAASDWYSLGATFFFAYTGVHYCAAAPSRMLIQTMPSPWQERFLQLLHTTPEARFQVASLSPVDPPPPRVKKYRYWIAIFSLCLLVLLGAHYHWIRRPIKLATVPEALPPTPFFDSTQPLHLKANETQHLTLTSCTLSFLRLEAHAVLTLDLPEGDVTLKACDIHPDAKLIFTGKGTFNLHQNEQAKFKGTLQLNDEITLNSHGIHTHTTPKLITSKGATVIASLGNDKHSMHLFQSIDMSKGGTIIGHGIRFYLTHNPANTILLGDGAILDLPWTSQRASIRCTAGTSELRSLNAHIGGSLWLSAAPDATLKVSGDRLYMFDYWRGDDIFIAADNQGTIIFDFRECCPLSSFHLQNGTTIFRCDMTQDVEKNWSHKRWTEDWVLYSKATLKGNTTLTFANNSQLIVCENATLEAGENQQGSLSCNRVTLEADARLLASGNTHFHIDHLTLHGDSHILDLKNCTHATPLSWTTLIGEVSTISCVNVPEGKRVLRTPTAITLVDENN